MIYQILDTEKIIISGSDPQTPEDFSELRRLGISHIINLQMGYVDFFIPKDRNHEIHLADKVNILTTHLMMSDFMAPTFQDLDCALSILKKYGGVYFHCRRGKDRTGMVRAAFRVLHQNWDVERAIKEMDDLGHAKFPYFWWQPHLKKYIISRK